MQGKIALEEHFAIEDTALDSKGFFPDSIWSELRGRVLDFQTTRIARMDEAGIAMTILSLNAPAVQAIPDAARAADVARRANDMLAQEVARRPDRFAALATLPMQDPDRAARELERCVKELAFCGVLVNGFSQVGDAGTVAYCDEPQYEPLWSVVENLDIPFYLHPRNPLPGLRMYEGHRWLLGPTWAFGVETATHALRLMGSGLFDSHPRLQIVLGHLGEGLPYSMWRVDNRNSWMKVAHPCPAKKKMAEYFCANFHLTTAGNFRTQTLIDAMLEIGVERIMFSTDYPFEDMSDAANWFDAAPISEPDRLKIGRGNAIKLFRLPLK